MSEDISELKKKISELEEALEDKEIMINALLKDIKRRKEIKTTDTVCKIENTKLDHIQSVEVVTTEVNVVDEPVSITPSPVWIYKYKLKEDLDICLGRKKIVRVFKDNVFFDDFVDYCSDIYIFKSFEIQKIVHGKNVKEYLQENKCKVLKYLISNLNRLSFSTVCSTFLALSSEFSCIEKCVIVHDIILYIQDFSKLLFYAFCILNGDFSTDSDLLMSTIHKILSFQYVVDIEIHKNKKSIINQLNNIKNIFNLKLSCTLEDFLLSLDCNVPVLLKCKLNPVIYQYIYSVRCLCHYLDWDYIYNVYILEKLSNDVTPRKILYMGLLALNSIRLFKNTESSDIIFSFIKDRMSNVNEEGIVSYLIMKQVNEKDSQLYLDKNKEALVSNGYEISYLSKLVIY